MVEIESERHQSSDQRSQRVWFSRILIKMDGEPRTTAGHNSATENVGTAKDKPKASDAAVKKYYRYVNLCCFFSYLTQFRCYFAIWISSFFSVAFECTKKIDELTANRRNMEGLFSTELVSLRDRFVFLLLPQNYCEDFVSLLVV